MSKTSFAIELTRDEYAMLLTLLGVAAANAEFRMDALKAANAISRNNPAWTPYVVDEPC